MFLILFFTPLKKKIILFLMLIILILLIGVLGVMLSSLFLVTPEITIQNHNFKMDNKTNGKPKIWMYWETPVNTTKPAYIELCQESVMRNCRKDFDVIMLSPDNIEIYLGKLPNEIQGLRIPQKADYIRLLALYRYGGIWLDSDIIVFRTLLPLMDPLQVYDFAGFGCHRGDCETRTRGYGKPANWAMIARPNSILMKMCLDKARHIYRYFNLNLPQNYHKLGRELLWSQIMKLEKSVWSYHHFDSKCIERDVHGKKYINERFLSETEEINLSCNSYFIPMYNTAPGFPSWFIKLSREEILSSNMFISKLLHYSFLGDTYR